VGLALAGAVDRRDQARNDRADRDRVAIGRRARAMTGQVDSDRPTPSGSQRLRPARLDPVELGTTGESMDEQHRTLAREAVDGEPELRRHRFSDPAATSAPAAGPARAWIAVWVAAHRIPRHSAGTAQGRWSSLNRSERPRSEPRMRRTVQHGSTATAP